MELRRHLGAVERSAKKLLLLQFPQMTGRGRQLARIAPLSETFFFFLVCFLRKLWLKPLKAPPAPAIFAEELIPALCLQPAVSSSSVTGRGGAGLNLYLIVLSDFCHAGAPPSPKSICLTRFRPT